MYKICQSEKSLLRQRELENGFLDYLENVSFFDMDIAGLCRYLSIPRKTFYRYFGSKEDALYALVDHRFRDMDQQIIQSASQVALTVKQSGLNFFAFWKEQKRFLDILHQNHLSGVLFSRINSAYMTGIREPFFILPSARMAYPYLYTFLMSSAMSVMFQWYLGGYRESIPQMAALMEELISAPIQDKLQQNLQADLSIFAKIP